MELINQDLISIIRYTSGIKMTENQCESLKPFIEHKLKFYGFTLEEYCEYIKIQESELELLINECTVSQTYFFREESQFTWLYTSYFPKHLNDRINIWSMSCSTGEEAVSLYALTHHIAINANIIASDINTESIEKFRTGIFPLSSFKSDGNLYHNLIYENGERTKDSFILRKDVLDNINITCYNVKKAAVSPVVNESIDIIFFRNTMIYFDEKIRPDIFTKLWTMLKPDGLLFLSITEIGCIDIPENLFTREGSDGIYYLRKRNYLKEAADQQQIQNNFDETSSNKESESSQRESISRKIREKQETAKKRQQEQLKQLVVSVKELLSSKDTASAKRLVEKFQFRAENLEYKHYLLGIICDKNQASSAARQYFDNALIINSKFWPALLQLGFIQKRENNYTEYKQTFSRCLSLLKECDENKNICYNFIIEDFDTAYLIEMCTNFIKETEQGF